MKDDDDDEDVGDDNDDDGDDDNDDILENFSFSDKLRNVRNVFERLQCYWHRAFS